MKTIEEIRDLMVGKSVITNLADLLRANDEEFAESEKKYLAAVETLRSELPVEFVPTLDEYLAACESDVISGTAYAGYKVMSTISFLTLSVLIPSALAFMSIPLRHFLDWKARNRTLKTHVDLNWTGTPARKKSIAKRILYAIKTDIYADDNQVFCFDWLISHCDKLRIALQTCDTLALRGKEHHSEITMEMTQIAYDMAKQVYSKSVSLTEGRELLVKETGMNSASAGDYINNFLAMMSGKCYCRTMNSQTTRYYLERILEDYGKDALNNALTACEAHTKYYAKKLTIP